MLVEHGATVLPFTDALLRRPKKPRPRAQEPTTTPGGALPDNVIVLAQFALRSRRADRLPDGPGGEAA